MKWFAQKIHYLARRQRKLWMEKLPKKNSSINNNNGNIQVIKRANMKINLIPNLMAMHC